MPYRRTANHGRRNTTWFSNSARVCISLWILVISLAIAGYVRLQYAPPKLHDTLPPATTVLIEKSLRTPAVSFLHKIDHDLRVITIPYSEPPRKADSTAIVLNWSRFPNVRRIANLLCSFELADIFDTIMIWNNSPIQISYQDFGSDLPCSMDRLKIVNSAQNLYFQARFLACLSTSSTYCYLQDDDYLVLPEVIRSLHTRVSESSSPSAVHLLPAHERLSSDLRYVSNITHGLHTSFAWLGHGTIIHRSQVVDFLPLMHDLAVSDEEMQMADNYFSVLSNRVPETWFDQGIELGGGQPFTVGVEGDARNNRHIMRATQYLDSRLTESRHAAVRSSDNMGENVPPPSASNRAPCRGRVCILEVAIPLFPDTIIHEVASAQQMLESELRNRERFTDDFIAHYMQHPSSSAVDGDPETAFRSISAGRANESISLDLLTRLNASWTYVELSWLVDDATVELLQECLFESSVDNQTWMATVHSLVCFATPSRGKYECSVRVDNARHFRARLSRDVGRKWAVYEVWLRGKESNLM